VAPHSERRGIGSRPGNGLAFDRLTGTRKCLIDPSGQHLAAGALQE